ncbi:MAG: hypothetical protein AAFQ67_02885 [Pseudomonadota bacterium]
MGRLFDAYVIVDWSAASKPTTGVNSIWVGVLAPDARLKLQFTAVNPETRLKARGFIQGIIERLTGRGDKVLLGFDFAFGFPDGTAEKLGLTKNNAAPWSAMQAHIADRMKDKEDNSNNRFALAASMNYTLSGGPFPFWGATSKKYVSNTLSDKKGDFAASDVPEHRTSELYLRDQKKGQPKSVWQLAYTGSVGGQTLTGLPHVRYLREALPNARLWPFETGLQPLTPDELEATQVLICEVYPSLVEVKPEPGEIVDAAQVRTLASRLAALDEKGRLGQCFGPPDGLDSAQIPQIEREEGWILAE